MNFVLKINGEILEEWFCDKHKKWKQAGDEMTCCDQEQEGALNDF